MAAGGVEEEAILGDRSGPPPEGGPLRPTNVIILVMVSLGIGVMFAGFLLTKLPPVKRPEVTYSIRHDSLSWVKDQVQGLGAGIVGILKTDTTDKPDIADPSASAASASSPTEVKDGHVIPKVDYKK